MFALRFSRVLPVCLLLALSACASAPNNVNNICSVFEQRDGWFNNWQTGARRAERKYGVPIPVLMATLRQESGFQSNAKPARTKLLGFIPWKRPSSAYGYSQALDGAWEQYQRESGNRTARRTSFDDAVDFVGWYHAKSADTMGIARNDTYNLYLAYYLGWSGYRRGDWQGNASVRKSASSTDAIARNYAAQMRQCGG